MRIPSLFKILFLERRLPWRCKEKLKLLRTQLFIKLSFLLVYKRKSQTIKNIGIVTTWFERGAAYVSKQYMNSVKNDFKVYIYARAGKNSSDNPDWSFNNVTYDSELKNNISSLELNLFSFFKWIKKNKIDTIIFNEQQNHFVPIELAQKLDIKCFAYVDYYTKKNGRCPVSTFEKYDGCFCNTLRHYNLIKRCNKNTYYIPWGTDITLFDKPKFNRKVKITFFHNAGMWGINGRKGTSYLIEAWKLLLKKNKNIELIIHSQKEPPIKIPKNTRVIIKEKGPPGFYYLGDVYVYPTKLEGIGLSICEAMAVGLPVITTNNPPMNEFVKHNVNGRLIKVKEFKTRDDFYYWDEAIVDINDLVKQMQYYINYPNKIIEHGKNARKLCKKKFDWNKNGKKVLEIIKRIQKERKQ